MKRLQDYIVENIVNIFEATKEQIEYARDNEGVHEIGGKCGWFETANTFNNWLFSSEQKAKNTLSGMFKHIDNNIVKNIIEQCYKACENYYDQKLTYLTVPFVIYTDKTNKFAIRTNVQNEIDIKEIINTELKKSKISNDIIEKINQNFDETHTGFGTSAIKGLSFEPQLVDALINYIISVKSAAIKKNEEYNNDEIKNLGFVNKNLFLCAKKIDELYNLVGENGIYQNTGVNQLKDLIKTTGTGKTGRQQDMKIIDPDTFDIINDKDINDLLLHSGSIIADVTCFDPSAPNDKSKAKIYISCKIGKAQLSGITNNSVFYKDGKRLKHNELFNMNLDKTNKLFNPLKGFCELLGMNYDTVFEFYSNLGKHIDKVNKRELIDYNNDIYTLNDKVSDDLKRLLLCIVGSNYCYVNGDHPENIIKLNVLKDSLNKIDIKFTGNAGISNSGRTIKRYANINGQNCFFCFRQSKESHRYPYRFFVGDLDVAKFIKSIQN